MKDYPDLIEKEEAKEELHQRVDDLHDELWNICEQKRKDATQERKNVMESTWIQNQIKSYIIHMKNLMRIEIS